MLCLIVLTGSLAREDALFAPSAQGAVADAVGLTLPSLPTPHHPATGYTERVACVADPEVTYKLFLPSVYARDTEGLFPVLIVQDPSGRPNIKRYLDWAIAREVILVGIDRVANGMLQHHKPRYWKAVVADLEQRGVRVEPGLFFTIGMSGGSADGERFSRQFPAHVAGVVLMGVCNFPTGAQRAHIAVAVLAGAKDPLQTPMGLAELRQKAASSGNPFREMIEPDRAHDWAPMPQQRLMLDWMLDTGRLVSPRLAPERRAANLSTARQAMVRATELTDPAQRRQAAERWLAVASLRAQPEAASLSEAWCAAVLQQARMQGEVADGLILMAEALADGPEPMPGAIRDALLDQQRVWRQQTRPAREEAAWQALRGAIRVENEAGLDKVALRRVIEAYGRILQEFPGTRAAQTAGNSCDRIKRYL